MKRVQESNPSTWNKEVPLKKFTATVSVCLVGHTLSVRFDSLYVSLCISVSVSLYLCLALSLSFPVCLSVHLNSIHDDKRVLLRKAENLSSIDKIKHLQRLCGNDLFVL